MEPEMKGTPEHPVPTIQYPSAEAVHPNREDYDRERKRRMAESNQVAPKPLKMKIADALEWIIRKNNGIRFSSITWLIIFLFYWLSAVVVMMGVLIGINAAYSMGGIVFDTGLTAMLFDVAGFFIIVVFPAYAVFYAVLAITETIQRRKEYRTNMELQAKFL
jgi:hypothetical protein